MRRGGSLQEEVESSRWRGFRMGKMRVIWEDEVAPGWREMAIEMRMEEDEGCLQDGRKGEWLERMRDTSGRVEPLRWRISRMVEDESDLRGWGSLQERNRVIEMKNLQDGGRWEWFEKMRLVQDGERWSLRWEMEEDERCHKMEEKGEWLERMMLLQEEDERCPQEGRWGRRMVEMVAKKTRSGRELGKDRWWCSLRTRSWSPEFVPTKGRLRADSLDVQREHIVIRQQ